MIKQNIHQIYPTANEKQLEILLIIYQNQAVQQLYSVVQQIKSKFPQPNLIEPQGYPNQDEVIDFFKNQYKAYVIDYSTLLTDSSASIKLYKNAVYYGLLEQGQRQGLGILIKDNQLLYEGTFNKDKKDGVGFELLKNNGYYYGHYSGGVPHGEGYFHVKNQTYIGLWNNGKKHGIGWCQGNKDDYYLGQWEAGKLNGLCLSVCQDIYLGEVSNDLKHGEGQEYFENGDYFSGEYRNGKPNGYGEYKWSNGNIYKGEFQNGLRYGQGIWQSQQNQQSNSYQGEYSNDQKNGKGVFHYANGTIYDGHFIDDKRCGYGEMHWPDGAIYRGYWQNNLMDGEGIYQYKQITLKGLWRNNQFKSYDKVRMSLNNFPVTNQLKDIKEDEEIHSELADEPDKDAIGDQFKNEHFGNHKAISEQSKSINDITILGNNKLPILKQQFDLLSVLDRSLQLTQVSQSIGIQTESKKKFLPKLQQIQEKRNQSVDHSTNSNYYDKFRFDSISCSPQTRTRDTEKNRSQKTSNRSVQVNGRGRGKKNRQMLLSQKEMNLWQIKMNKLKLSPKKYMKVWNPHVVSEIKQLIYPPIWKPPSHVI